MISPKSRPALSLRLKKPFQCRLAEIPEFDRDDPELTIVRRLLIKGGHDLLDGEESPHHGDLTDRLGFLMLFIERFKELMFCKKRFVYEENAEHSSLHVRPCVGAKYLEWYARIVVVGALELKSDEQHNMRFRDIAG